MVKENLYIVTYECSTPYGISYRITGSHVAGSPDDRGAQRLTASHIESLGSQLDDYGTILKCSTPYGISYRITFSEEFRDGFVIVLNALRHLI